MDPRIPYLLQKYFEKCNKTSYGNLCYKHLFLLSWVSEDLKNETTYANIFEYTNKTQNGQPNNTT